MLSGLREAIAAAEDKKAVDLDPINTEARMSAPDFWNNRIQGHVFSKKKFQ